MTEADMAVRATRIAASPQGLEGIAHIRRHLAGRPSDGEQTIERRRIALAQATAASSGIAVEHDIVNGVPVERHAIADPVAPGTLLFVHGGCFVSGSAATHRGVAAQIAAGAGQPLISVDYRLAPEHPFPAGRDDLIAVYENLLANAAMPIALIGDSAGGGLVMQAVLAMANRGLPMPSCIALISPWVDLACASASYRDRAAVEALLDPKGFSLDSMRYRTGRPATDPALSPVHAFLGGLPPVLIQVGEHEMLYDDTFVLARRMVEAGVHVAVEEWDGMIHAWHAFRSILPEAGKALTRIARFVSTHNVARHGSPCPPGFPTA